MYVKLRLRIDLQLDFSEVVEFLKSVYFENIASDCRWFWGSSTVYLKSELRARDLDNP